MSTYRNPRASKRKGEARKATVANSKKRTARKASTRKAFIEVKHGKTVVEVKHRKAVAGGGMVVKSIDYIEKLYSVSEDLYIRDIVETNHAVNSGTTSIAELKVKYEKFIK